MAKTPEGKVKDLVKAWLKERNIWNFMPIPSAFGASTGCSDILGIYRGRFLCIEVKADGKAKNVTPRQQAFIDRVNAEGGIGVVVSCQADLDALEARLNG